MKAVILSVRPKWCASIANGEKTVEVRKNKPNLQTPFKCYIYETLGKMHWADIPIPKDQGGGYIRDKIRDGGKVIGEFVCDDATLLTAAHYRYIEKYACVSVHDIKNYMGIKEGLELTYLDGCYGWHISSLKMYDNPLQISDFTQLRNTKFGAEPVALKRPPQSWCYVEEQEEQK